METSKILKVSRNQIAHDGRQVGGKEAAVFDQIFEVLMILGRP